MPRQQLPKLVCPRCSYETKEKGSMRRHFYIKKEVCPASTHDIELTDEIKEYVLKNRHYPIPKETTLTQIINNNQMINNYIGNMDTFAKLNHVLKYKQMEIQDFDEKIEEHFEPKLPYLNNIKREIVFEKFNFFDMLHDMITAKHPSMKDFNFFYDKDQERVKLYQGDKWCEYSKEEAAMYLIDILVSNYLDYYEMYLIRKAISCNLQQKSTIQESIENYYRFTSAFGIKPFVQGKTDSQILYNSCEYQEEQDPIASHRLVDHYSSVYLRCKNEVKESQKKELFKSVIDMFKTSTKTNILELNKLVMELISVNKEFKEAIM